MEEMQSSFMDPTRHVQVELVVDKLYKNDYRLIWIQFLLECRLKEKRFLMFNIYQLDDDAPTGQKMTKRELRDAKKVALSEKLVIKFFLFIIIDRPQLTKTGGLCN